MTNVGKDFIPFFKSHHSLQSLDYLKGVLDSKHPSGSGTGKYCLEFEAGIKAMTKSAFSLAVGSCTVGLELALLGLNVKAGDEVIMPSFAFVAAPLAAALRGAKPVFCEIDKETLQLDLAHVEALITSKTVGILPVHYNGYSCDMEKLELLARKHALWIVEDAAQALGASYKGKALGTFGVAGAISFHETKNISAGEAGIFLTQDKSLALKTEIMREKGTNRTAFFRGEVDKYTWQDIGGSHIPSELNCALALANLQDWDYIQNRRKTIDGMYRKALAGLSGIKLFQAPQYNQPNHHMFPILIECADREIFQNKLKEYGVGTASHFVPLHLSGYSIRTYGTQNLKLAITENVCDKLLRLPLYPALTDEEIARVVDAVKNCLKHFAS